MSATKIYSIFCDGPSCLDWIAQSLDLKEARKEARQAGWISNAQMDLCPKCIKKARSKK